MIPSLRQEIDDGPAAVIFLLAQLVLVADIVIYPIFFAANHRALRKKFPQ